MSELDPENPGLLPPSPEGERFLKDQARKPRRPSRSRKRLSAAAAVLCFGAGLFGLAVKSSQDRQGAVKHANGVELGQLVYGAQGRVLEDTDSILTLMDGRHIPCPLISPQERTILNGPAGLEFDTTVKDGIHLFKLTPEANQIFEKIYSNNSNNSFDQNDREQTQTQLCGPLPQGTPPDIANKYSYLNGNLDSDITRYEVALLPYESPQNQLLDLDWQDLFLLGVVAMGGVNVGILIQDFSDDRNRRQEPPAAV